MRKDVFEINLRKNEIITGEITDISSSGSGVCRHQGFAVFVPYTAVGDILKIRIVKVQKSYAFGIADEILTPSPDRCSAECDAFPRCGGCVFRHIKYTAELHYKEKAVREALSRIGGINIPVEPIVSCEPERYRNKAIYPVSSVNGEIRIGFFQSRTHQVIPAEFCVLAPPEFSDIIAAVKNWIIQYNISIYDESTGKGLIRHIYLRKAFATGEIMLCIIINGSGIPCEDELIKYANSAAPLTGIILNINKKPVNTVLSDNIRVIWGREYITDRICGLILNISPLSFYQVNPAVTELLYRKVEEYARPAGCRILDLYCGIGSIGLFLAKTAEKLTGVEIIPKAAENAKTNALLNNIDNAEFFLMDSVRAAELLKSREERPEIIILDPPRKGCAPELIETISSEFVPKRIVYVSCDPATLARDLKIFAGRGYNTEKAAVFDMFPRTGHVETIVLIQRQNT